MSEISTTGATADPVLPETTTVESTTPSGTMLVVFWIVVVVIYLLLVVASLYFYIFTTHPDQKYINKNASTLIIKLHIIGVPLIYSIFGA